MSEETLSSKEFLTLVDKKELESINRQLDVADITATEVVFPDDALDREKAEKVSWDEMQNSYTANASLNIAAAARQIHEASRARRDINIATAGHKKLMLGCYNTLYQRKLHLEEKLQQET